MKTKTFSLSAIALGNLKRRKRQYVLLALGIALAIYFVATALLFGFGIYTSLQERELNRYGEQDGILFDCGDAPLNELTADGALSAFGKVEVLGDVVTGDTQSRMFAIACYDDTAKELSRRRLREGTYPTQAGEIALEQAVLAQLRQKAGVGDTVTLTLRIPDGNGGFLDGMIEKTFTLTGILYDQHIYRAFNEFNSAYQDIPAGLVSDAELVEPGGRAVTMAFCTYGTQSAASQKALDDFCEAYGISNMWSGSIYTSDSTREEMVFTGGFAVLIGLILVVACCLGIVNAFSANLDARRRQIGLLRAVGATQKQIRNIFGRETLILSLIAIPLGLGLSVLSVFAIFSWLGEDYVLILSPWVLLGVAVLGVLCVALASYIPLRRASRVSPMQVIRDVDLMRRVHKRGIKSRTAFIAPRLIAARSGRIYRRKRAGISAAMVAGILVFSLAVMIMATVFAQTASHTYRDDYVIHANRWSMSPVNFGFHDPGLTEQDKQDVLALPLVKKVLGEKRVEVKLLPDKITSYATGEGWQGSGYLYTDSGGPQEEWMQWEREAYHEIRDQYYGGADYLSTSAIAVEESIIEQLKPYVCEGSINLDKLRSGEEILLAAPEEYALYYKADKGGNGYNLSENPNVDEGYTLVTSQTNDMFHAGDTLPVSLLYTDAQESDELAPEDVVRVDKTVTIGAVLDISWEDYEQLDMDAPGFLEMVTTLPGLAAMGFDVPYSALSVRLSETPDAPTEEYLSDAIGQIAARVPDSGMSSRLEYARENRRMAAQSMILSVALSILMFAIVASMMNNALSAHIRAGRRSIGTLRAVGMDSRDIFRSYFYQMMPMFAWGVVGGFVLSLLAGHFVIQHLIQSNALIGDAPQLPVWQPLVFAALLLAVCALNVRARLRGILCESITENIREL